MATNKRKDAAALFELIDKSTLKIPKNAASLKIPSWWSSKTNPAAPAAPVAPIARTAAIRPPASEAAPAVAPETPAPSYAPTPLFAHADATAPTTPAPSFAPPPPAAAPVAAVPEAPAAAPSSETPPPLPETAVAAPAPVAATPAPIAAAPLAPTPVAPAPAPVKPLAPAAPSFRPPATPAPAPAARPVAAASTPKPAHVFAPATMDPAAASRRSNYAAQKQALLRTPKWAVLGLLAIAVVIIGLGAMLLHRRGGSESTTTAAADNRGDILNPTNPDGGTPGVRPMDKGVTTSRDPQPQNIETPKAAAQVFEEKDVPRSANLRYLIIASHPYKDIEIARHNAKFLADHGVSVSLAPQRPSAKTGAPMLIHLISVQGFPGLTDEAQAFDKKVREIGKLHPDFKRNHNNSVWNDTYFLPGSAFSKNAR